MVSCEVAKYTIMGWDDTGFTKIGGSASIFLIIEKVCSHCSFHLKAYAFLNIFIIGFDLSATPAKILLKQLTFRLIYVPLLNWLSFSSPGLLHSPYWLT